VILPIFHESFLLTPGFFPLKTKKYLRRHPADCRLEYIYFMKIGQPKLSERETQRSGLFVPPTTLALERFWDSTITVEIKN
jgi:hypothetical protein